MLMGKRSKVVGRTHHILCCKVRYALPVVLYEFLGRREGEEGQRREGEEERTGKGGRGRKYGKGGGGGGGGGEVEKGVS
jgi:hypothetical protein